MTARNLLEMVPRRATEESRREAGRARFEFPRFHSRLGRAWGRLFRASATIAITLDEKGTAAWDLVDGRRTVGEIGEALRGRFGPEVEPVATRLAELIALWERNRLITFR